MAYVELRNLIKSFGPATVIRGISADIEEGEFVVILGPSGCGKSTVLRMIAGLESVDDGEIRIAGKRVDHLPPKSRGSAMVFQNYALYPHLTVHGNIGYGLRVARMPRQERESRISNVAAMLELEDFLNHKPAQLSGGQRQRVAIARAIAREPKVFLFDEPLSNLDAKLRASTRLELRRLHDRIGATSIFVTHDQIEAMTLADRIIVFNRGRIAQVGTPSEIYHNPADLFVAGFVGTPATNRFQGTVVESLNAVRIHAEICLEIAKPASRLSPRQDVTIAVRPEEAIIGEDGMEVLVEQVEDVGSQRFLHCTSNGLDIVAREHGSHRYKRGERTKLRFPKEAILIFDSGGDRVRNSTAGGKSEENSLIP